MKNERNGFQESYPWIMHAHNSPATIFKITGSLSEIAFQQKSQEK
jgi:hypothetical protein